MQASLFPISTPSRPKSNLGVQATLLLILILGSGCQSNSRTQAEAPAAFLPGDLSAPSQVTPLEAMEIARQFTDHLWQPFASNMLHGKDAKGIKVDTPDFTHERATENRGWWLPGQVNKGIPYKWGGFDDPGSFDQAIAEGLAAGDVSTPEKRKLDNAAVSQFATGVDCSGFISRCLKLPSVHDTTQLPRVCEVLPSFDELQPGDILNVPRRHVVLFAGWAKPDRSSLYYYETGGKPDRWRPGLKESPRSSMLALQYQPLRYRGMATETIPSGKEVLTRSVKASAIFVAEPDLGEP